jgi:hypothetical protein
MVTVGAVVGWWFDKRANRTSKPDAMKQLGTLLASGLIVGESVLAVGFTAWVAFSGKPFPAELLHDAAANASFELAGMSINYTMLAAGIGFASMIYLTYRWLERLAKA